MIHKKKKSQHKQLPDKIIEWRDGKKRKMEILDFGGEVEERAQRTGVGWTDRETEREKGVIGEAESDRER